MDYRAKLSALEASGSLRRIQQIVHDGRWVKDGTHRMLNLSSNDYLGLSAQPELLAEFWETCPNSSRLFSASSSRLLTGNFEASEELEELLATAYGHSAALIFNSGYHANTGILPALAGKDCLIIADKLVHASIIDGMKLSSAPFLRFRHQDYVQLENIIQKESAQRTRIFVIVESVYSMDGDVTDLRRLAAVRRRFPNVCLYVDEAHAVGVRGQAGLGIAEEQGVLAEIDLLVGTFGKALDSQGAYLICDEDVREYLVNTARSLIFSTALPPIQLAWTAFLFRKLPLWQSLREHLFRISRRLSMALEGRGGEISRSHIVPFIIGDNTLCQFRAEQLRRKGFYCLPVRPPSVPQGTSRIRFSLSAGMTDAEMDALIEALEV